MVATFVRLRLQDISGKNALNRECNNLQCAFDRFVEDHRLLVGSIDSRRLGDMGTFISEVGELSTRLETQIRHRLAGC